MCKKSDMLSSAPSCEASGKAVLFLGRSNCAATQNIRALLDRFGFDVTYIESYRRGEVLPEIAMTWVGDYILSYRSLFILPQSLISMAKIAAINFHPGPPEYPGSGCINFALYDNASQYGVTAHIVDSEVDSGRILECRRFPVLSEDTVDTLLHRTHFELEKLCADFIKNISAGGGAFIKESLREPALEQWVGKARKMKELEALEVIDPQVEKDELERIIRATYTENFPPKIMLHGYEFTLKSNEQK